MRHLPFGVEIWGAFLIIVGVALLVFNKRWTAWATPRTPMQFIPIAPSIKTAVGRLITVALGLVFVVVGASAFLPIGPGPR
ncbi:MAG: hypothetical protein M3082_11995 [Candidatus Dormibacteraeota bacterium]|nr:hypothetical protein [Candidatus Dormibacteraeota bacterium]